MAEEAFKNNDSVQDQWGQICTQLKTEFGETAYDSWLKPLSIGSLHNGIMNICVPTAFMKNWVITHYSERIHRIWENTNPEIKKLNFVVQTVNSGNKIHCGDTSLLKKISSTPTPQNIFVPQGSPLISVNENLTADSSLQLSAPLNPAYTFDSFIVGKTNEFAYAAARKVAESKNVSFNPLFLYSGVGLGKTHLMHAIAWHIRQKDPTRNVIYLSAEQFLY
jgi:chromosomal replication initiator protein